MLLCSIPIPWLLLADAAGSATHPGDDYPVLMPMLPQLLGRQAAGAACADVTQPRVGLRVRHRGNGRLDSRRPQPGPRGKSTLPCCPLLWLAGWLASWLDGWMDGWMDGEPFYG